MSGAGGGVQGMPRPLFGMKLILDLCGVTGAWSAPYREAGYDVDVVDLPRDVRLFRPPRRAHGVLAAPPCTMFCRMRMCRGEPSDEQFREALSVVDACLRIAVVVRPKFWALENPQGYLTRWLGPPQLRFDPCDFGDSWTKRTWIWGNFVPPMFKVAKPEQPWISSRTGHPKRRKGIARNAVERSMTPPGFARAFFEANP